MLLTAVGVGAEHAAINAAISEFIPARHRGKANATGLTVMANAAGMLAALVLLAAFWLNGAIAMVPLYFRGVEGRGMALEALVD